MNHSSKISLVLLIPFSIFASDAGKKPITFVPGKPLATTTTTNNSTTTSAATASLSDSLGSPTATTSSSSDTSAAKKVTSNKLGDLYEFDSIPAQTADYRVGKDGIAKFTNWETSSTYTARLIHDGKFASAAKHQQDSFLADHIRRDLDTKKDALIAAAKTDSKNTTLITEKQRATNITLFGALSVALQAIKEHAPTEITPSTIEGFITTTQESMAVNTALLEIFSKEIDVRKKFLESTIQQLKAIKDKQQTQNK